MSQDYKLKFDELRDNLLGKNDDITKDYTHASDSYNRTLSLVWQDRRMKFLNYAYLVTGEYDPEGIIKLMFTSETITLQGVHLENLYYDLVLQKVRQIEVCDHRYNSTVKDYAVNQIIVEPLK